MSMFAWVFRFGLLGLGSPDFPGVLLFILSCIVYGIAFDFFNISGSLYVNQKAPLNIRSSAQGLFMMMTNGLGATIGTLGAGAVVKSFHVVKAFEGDTPELQNWPAVWYIFAGFALVVGLAFMVLFKNPGKEEKVVA